MRSVSLIDPFRCRMWDLHMRLESDISEETCKAEIESFLKNGQLVPALGRPLKRDPSYDVELVYGARRLFIARHLNKPLAVELRDVSDREGIIAMDIENRQRKDVSPYERGRSCARWLEARYFNSQEDIARALHLSGSQVSRLLRLARLPDVIVNAFASPEDICERWGLELLEIWEDPASRPAIARQAREISAMALRPAAAEILHKLASCGAAGSDANSKAREEAVIGASGRALFRIRRQTRSFTLLLPHDKVSPSSLERIQEAVMDILQDVQAPCVSGEDRSNTVLQPLYGKCKTVHIARA